MKKKNNIPEMIKGANIIIYDDENIKYYSGKFVHFQQEAIVDSGRFADGTSYNHIMGYNVMFRTYDFKDNESIKLDDTTMKRIAKFNKEQECVKLDEKIKEKKEKIKELDNLLQDKEKRWNKVKKYIVDIYDLDLNEYDDYYDEY